MAAVIQQTLIYQSDNHFISEYRHENPTLGTGFYTSKYSQHFFGEHVVDDAGFIYVTGRSGRFGGQYFPADATTRSISKLTPMGNVIFTKDFNTLDIVFKQMFFADNHIYCIGYMMNTENSSGTNVGTDSLIVKLTTDLSIVWFRLLGNDDTSTHHSDFLGFAIDSSNNVYVTGEGYRAPGTSGPFSASVVKYNSGGTLQWKKLLKYDTGNNNTSESFGSYEMIHIDSSDGLYVTGETSNAGGGNKNSGTPNCNLYMQRSCHVKLNTSGSVIWKKARRNRWTVASSGDYTGCYRTYGNAGGSGVDSNGNLYAAINHSSLSYIPSYNSLRSDAMSLLKRNSSGTIQWEKCFYVTNTSNSNFTTALSKQIQFDNDDNIYLSCRSNFYTGSPSVYQEPIIILKFNSSGTLQWARKINRSNIKTGSSTYAPYASTFKLDKNKECFTISGSFTDANASPDIYHGYILKLPIDGSKTGTYGNWTYSVYSDATFSNNHPNSNVDITGVEFTSNVTTYNNPMVDRSSVSANNVTITTGAHPAKNFVDNFP